MAFIQNRYFKRLITIWRVIKVFINKHVDCNAAFRESLNQFQVTSIAASSYLIQKINPENFHLVVTVILKAILIAMLFFEKLSVLGKKESTGFQVVNLKQDTYIRDEVSRQKTP